MADETRHSKAFDAQIITDPDELARKESFNVVEQYRAVADMVESFLEPERPFKLRLSHLLHLHRAALDGISSRAGNFRPAGNRSNCHEAALSRNAGEDSCSRFMKSLHQAANNILSA